MGEAIECWLHDQLSSFTEFSGLIICSVGACSDEEEIGNTDSPGPSRRAWPERRDRP
ncbi:MULTISPECIES: hypothetical protein [unclassified Crossiella]|uniref:hypothetical protein n=1 Tax=unclassified Crossiella TaxID=2620835 RepID=UPI0020000660|nr:MULTISPECIES: hypothetical protein [unclassified Crossiella]MCK2240067.1 hypothetical protein [Crossiella sp. S99.2]MCK2252775.1 hypothetical protein [Crossiella sp. S99.1]